MFLRFYQTFNKYNTGTAFKDTDAVVNAAVNENNINFENYL